MFECYAPKCVRIRLTRPDWCRFLRGVLIGQKACRLFALAREAIESTHAGDSDYYLLL